MKQVFKTSLFTVICLAMAIAFIELIGRSAIAVYSRDLSSFLYGIQDNLKVRSQDRKITFYRIDSGTRKDPKPDSTKDSRSDRVTTLAAFGGSTTRGFNCSKNASSWPEQLEILLNSDASLKGTPFKVLNFGADGTNSDYAVDQLPLANANGRLEYVFWANFVNESDILFTGPKRNLEVLGRQFPEILGAQQASYTRYRWKLFVHRVDKTLEKYSLTYWGSHRVAQFLRAKYPVKRDNNSVAQGWFQSNKADKMIAMALENYRINFLAAKEYCESRNIKMFIVRLPLPVDQPGAKVSDPIEIFSRMFWENLDKQLMSLSRQHQVTLINVQDCYLRDSVPNSVFCDGAHQKIEGHKQTAKFVAEGLKTCMENRRVTSAR
jgi:hypothetical protein